MFRSLILLLVICSPLQVWALDLPPAPTYRVNDYAGVLTAQEKEELEANLRKHEEETSNQIVVAIFPSLEQESLEDFVNRLFIKWAIGQKTNNNGVLFAVFMKERKVRIEVGYGLEGRLTDAVASRIIRNEIAPEFRAAKYGEGIKRAVLAMQQAIAGEYKATPKEQPPQQGIPPAATFIAMMIFLYILYRARNRAINIDPRGRRRYRNDDWFIFPGGGLGGGGGWGSGGGWGGGGGGFSGGGGSSGGGGASGSW